MTMEEDDEPIVVHISTIEDPNRGIFEAPLAEATSGRLLFVSGTAPRLTVKGDSGLQQLFRARLERPTPDVECYDGMVAIRYRHFPFSFFKSPALPGEIRLNSTIPWAVELRGGAFRFKADLREIQLSELELTGGASNVEIELPAPSGTVPIDMTGGASELYLRRPAGTALRLMIRGGAASLHVDGNYFSAIGGETRWQTQDYNSVADRYEFTITGGASNVTIETY